MSKSELSRNERHALECYIRAQNRPISFSEVFRYYIPTLLRYGVIPLIAAVVAFSIPTSEMSIPANCVVGCCLLSMLCLILIHAIWESCRSIRHWELLKRVLDYERVRELLGDSD